MKDDIYNLFFDISSYLERIAEALEYIEDHMSRKEGTGLDG